MPLPLIPILFVAGGALVAGTKKGRELAGAALDSINDSMKASHYREKGNEARDFMRENNIEYEFGRLHMSQSEIFIDYPSTHISFGIPVKLFNKISSGTHEDIYKIHDIISKSYNDRYLSEGTFLIHIKANPGDITTSYVRCHNGYLNDDSIFRLLIKKYQPTLNKNNINIEDWQEIAITISELKSDKYESSWDPRKIIREYMFSSTTFVNTQLLD